MTNMRDPLGQLGVCGLPHALEVMGERWSFLILRAAFSGQVHFEEFSSSLGIARNILANRLSRLVSNGVLQRIPCEEDRRKVEYRLTEKGIALLPVMLALCQWGERYALNVPANPVLVDRRDGQPIRPITLQAQDGREVYWGDLAWQHLERLGEPVPEEVE